MVVVFGVSLGIGIIRGIRGWLKHKNEDDYEADPKRFLKSLGVSAVLGIIAEAVVIWGQIDIATAQSIAIQLVGTWVGTDVIEDIFA
jgi:hypothetical protein